MKKMMIAGMLVAVLMFSTLGVIVMAQETADDTAVSQEVSETQDELYLITPEQIEEVRDTILTMQEEHATRTEIRETVQTMSENFVNLNLESYGLTEAQIDEIQAKILELHEKMDEIRETAEELRDLDLNRMDIHEELQPLMDEAQVIRGELKDILDQYGIIPPEMNGPRMGEGRGHGQGDSDGERLGLGQGGRPGMFGEPGGSDGEGFGPGQGGRPGMFGEPGEFCDGEPRP